MNKSNINNSFFIAVTGKGGVGKTSFSAILIKNLIELGKKPILAIDADPNSCLDSALGVEIINTVGKAREEVREDKAKNNNSNNINISAKELLQIKLNESLIEASGFDLIAMGRPEGAGCYCYANNVLKQVISELAGQYPVVVLDNEAGLENLSRRIVQNQKVNIMCLVSDGSNSGLETLKRLYELAKEMNVEYEKLAIIINRVREGKSIERLSEIKDYCNADYVLVLPFDDELADYAESGKSLLELDENNIVCKKIKEVANLWI